MGFLVGVMLGPAVGCMEGFEEGFIVVGSTVGSSVGFIVGFMEGNAEGFVDGSLVELIDFSTSCKTLHKFARIGKGFHKFATLCIRVTKPLSTLFKKTIYFFIIDDLPCWIK